MPPVGKGRGLALAQDWAQVFGWLVSGDSRLQTKKDGCYESLRQFDHASALLSQYWKPFCVSEYLCDKGSRIMGQKAIIWSTLS